LGYGYHGFDGLYTLIDIRSYLWFALKNGLGKTLQLQVIEMGIESIKAMIAIAQSSEYGDRIYLKDVKGGL